MMNYEIFKEVVKEKFMDYMPDSFKGMELIVRPAEKVNMTYDAINIRGEDTTISPTIYINDMYEKYGYYKDDIQAITLKGIEGLQKIQEIMETLRNETPSEIAGYKVLSARDYKKDTIKNMESGEMTKTGLPSSNVLYYDLSDEAWLCVRPSGTEPKIKFYYGIKGTSLEDADQKSAALGEEVLAMINKML